MAAPNVAFPRPLVIGSKGKDVIAVKRALSRAGYMKWGVFTPTWGEFARNATHAFQSDHGLKKAGYGPKTHEKLRTTHRAGSKTEWAFGAYEVEIMHEVFLKLHANPETKIRTAIVQMWRYLYMNRAYIGYSQHRPFPLLHLGDVIKGKSYAWDCSGNFEIGHFAAGAKCPSVSGGRRLTWAEGGVGYTGTIMAGGRKCTKDELKAGDAVLYGFTTSPTPAFPYGSPTHVAGWEGDAYDSVFSLGHYPMVHTNYRYRHDINCYVTFDVTP